MNTPSPARLTSLTAALALGGALAPSTSGCTALVYGVGSSMNVTTPDVEMDLGGSMLTTVALALLPVDILLTWGLVDGGIDDLSAFLEQERRDLRVAIARGQGAAVTDLAQVLALPDRLAPKLGEALRAHRHLLDPPLAEPGPIDAVRGRRFVAGLGAALRSDHALAEAARRCVEVWRLTR